MTRYQNRLQKTYQNDLRIKAMIDQKLITVNASEGTIKGVSGKELTPYWSNNQKHPYLRVALKKGFQVYFHRVIAVAVSGVQFGKTINHIDFDKSNNHPRNLEYVTIKDNLNHALRGNRFPARKTRKVDRSILKDLLQKGLSIREIHEKGFFKCHIMSLYKIAKELRGGEVCR